ncbi:unnamed protein product [Gongylonema pulchrum]|uniref:Amiloride-sensitive sodium channel n=1 Tax=Gongylonema pulchrum TaxID=637853 RepID=A0A183EIX3_9BILA|nr:unnamed protein product [Gongylonema pulchrum]
MYGNCYTFLVTGLQYSGFVGPLYGLSLTLYVADREYLARHSQGSGFKVEVHPVEYIPFPEDKGFTISPGVMTSVGIKQMRISRMPLPYDGTEYHNALRAAGYSGPVNYTAQACMKSCYQRRLVEDCNCVDPSFVTRDDIHTFYAINNSQPSACDMTLTRSFECVRKSLTNSTNSGFCEKQCPQSCHEQGYVSRELNYESVVESPSQDVWDLLSNIGGTLGLYIGMSFLTLGEFAELFVKCLALPAQKGLQQLGASVDRL